MRLIAEFAMRGRRQAAIVALLGGLVPIITQVTVGLVSLRKGWQEGLLITLWGMLIPALVAYWYGDISPSLAAIGIAYIVAIVLRMTVSWSATLSSVVALSSLVALLAVFFVDGLVVGIQAFLSQVSQDMAPEIKEKVFGNPSRTWCGGMIGFMIAVLVLFGLVVSRWLQALLFNPGGFRKEFHQLRLHNVLALVCFVATVYCEFRGIEYVFWAHIFALPLIFAGLSLLHCAVARTKFGVGLLVVIYFGLFLIPPFALLTALVGLTDTWLDYRKRFNLMQPD